MVVMVRAGTGPSWLMNESNEKSGDISGENGFLEVGTQSGSMKFSGSPRRNGPAAPSSMSSVHKSCPTPNFQSFFLTINYLDHLWSVGRDRVLIAEERFKSLPSVPKPDWPPTWREYVFDRIFWRKIAGYSCLWLERIIPYQVVQVYCCLSSAFSADVRKKKMTSPVLPITEPVLW